MLLSTLPIFSFFFKDENIDPNVAMKRIVPVVVFIEVCVARKRLRAGE